MGIYLMSVHLMDAHLINVPLSWASLAGLFRGHVSASAPKLVSYASRPRACVLCLRTRASVPSLGASALQAHTVYPGPLGCFSQAQLAEASQG
jgi:hypothetical protein